MLYTINKLLDAVLFEGKTEIRVAEGYAEPGYEGGPVILADWNPKSEYDAESRRWIVIDDFMPRFGSLLERGDYSLEWCDEWDICDDCQKAFRIAPDSYSWKRYGYIFHHGDIICGDCICEDPADYLQDLEGDCRRAITIDGVDPTDGFIRINSSQLESGLYKGQNDDPKTIAASLQNLGVERFIFEITSTGQFDLRFSVYVHEDEIGQIPSREGWQCPRCRSIFETDGKCCRSFRWGEEGFLKNQKITVYEIKGKGKK